MKRGFTMFELVVVMAIVLVLVGTAVPVMSRYVQRRQLELAGFTLVQDLRRIQMDATFTRTERKVQFIPGSNWYRFETEAGSMVLPPRLDGLCKR